MARVRTGVCARGEPLGRREARERGDIGDGPGRPTHQLPGRILANESKDVGVIESGALLDRIVETGIRGVVHI